MALALAPAMCLTHIAGELSFAFIPLRLDSGLVDTLNCNREFAA